MTATPTALDVVDGVDLTGKTCVVTGASSGLGRESTRALAAAGAHVILAARNADDVAETIDWANTVLALGAGDEDAQRGRRDSGLDEGLIARTLGVVLKHRPDLTTAIKELKLG